jgi:hypothetical protein
MLLSLGDPPGRVWNAVRPSGIIPRYGFFFVLVLEMTAMKMMMTMRETAISATMVCSLGFRFD